MGRFDGRVAIVTGGGSGIGATTARMFAGDGASVVVADLNAKSAEVVRDEIVSHGGSAISVGLDVSDEDQVKGLIADTVGAFGRIDVLHNNAGLTSLDAINADQKVTDISVELWDRFMAVNARGPMLGCKHAIPVMLESGGGAIVNTSSGASLSGDLVFTAYGCSKAALNLLTQYVATQFGKSGIRCNAVLPGLVLSPASARYMSDEIRAIRLANVLTPYLGEPEDIAETVLFLASDAAKFITGQLIPVNGGVSSHSPYYSGVPKYLGDQAL